MGITRRILLSVLILITSAVSSQAVQRTVLVELFGNIGCGFCTEAEAVLHDLDLQHDDDELLAIEWHVSWPAWDPWYHANIEDNEARREFYNIWYVPAFKTDGWLPSNTTSLPYHWEYEYFENGETPVSLGIYGDFDADEESGFFQVTVQTSEELPEGEYRLFAALTEEVTHYNGAYYNTFHKSFPDSDGWEVDEFPAQFEYSFDFCGDDAGGWDADECKIIVWLQDITGDKIVWQAESSMVCDLRAEETAAPETALGFSLGAAYPNPFNPRTIIPIRMDERGAIRLEVLAPDGRRVKLLHEGQLDAGSHEFVWDGKDARGRPVASGVYLARNWGSRGGSSQRLVLMK